MKIVLLAKYNENDILSGPEKVAKRIFHFLSLKKYHAIFIEHYFKNLPQSNIYKRHFGFELVNEAPILYRMGFFRLFFYLLKNQPDIIHIASLERFIIPLFFYKFLLRSKIITTAHSILKYELQNRKKNISYYSTFKDSLVEWLAFKFSDKIIFVSDILKNLAYFYYKIDQSKFEIISNGIDNEFYQQSKIKNFDFSNGINIVFYNISSEYIQRGFEFVLNSINNSISDSNLRINLYVIGKLSSNIQQTNNIQIIQINPMNQKDLIKFIEDKHIILKSNSFDSFSMMVAESMAAGLIAIVSDNVGIAQYIKNGENGFVYDKNNSLELSRILKNIIEGKYQLAKISTNAREIIEQLNWDKIADKYLETYKSVINY